MGRYKGYSEYRGSGVEWLGSIPSHWVITPLKYLMDLNPSKSSYLGSQRLACSFVPMEKLKKGSLTLDEERVIADVISGYTYFENGDVLQAKVTPCFENKNIAIAENLKNGIGFGSSEINVYRPYEGELVKSFLYYRCQEDAYMEFCTSAMIGAGGLKRVPSDTINNFPIALPTVMEQSQIAKFLDCETAKIDTLISKQERLIELLREKRQAVISHAVTKGLDGAVGMKDSGVEWLGEVPEHWGICSLSKIFTIKAGGDVQQRLFSEVKTEEHKYPIYTNSNKENAIYGYSKEANYPADSITVSGRGEVGFAVYRDHEFEAIIRLLVLTPQKACEAKFFTYLINEVLEFREESSAVGQLSTLQIAPYKTVLPPLEEQIQITEYLDRESKRVANLIEKQRLQIELLKERRTALISAAVTGKIDVRDVELS